MLSEPAGLITAGYVVGWLVIGATVIVVCCFTDFELDNYFV